MSTEIATATCGKCTQTNDPQAKFCAGCGQPLWEPCPVCKASVRLGAKFCGDCGEDLTKRFEQRLQQVRDALQRAGELADSHQYDDALAVLSRYRKPADYRFQNLAAQATQLSEQVQQASSAWQTKLARVHEVVEQAVQAERHDKVQTLVEKIPEPLRSDQLKQWYTQSRTADSEYTHLYNRLRAALQAKDHTDAAGAVSRLLQIKPADDRFTRVAEKVAAGLLASASRRFDRGDYHGALQRLDAVPETVRNEQTAAMQRRARNVVWLIDQFDHQPWATPALTRIAQRLSQAVPRDKRAEELHRKLLKIRQQRPEDPRSLFCPWDAQVTSWLGGPVRMLAVPQSIKVGDPKIFAKHPGEYVVAIGLALQGLGQGRISEPLHRAETKGLKKFFRRKGQPHCIGIDAGSNAIRAVQLRLGEDGQVELVDCFRHAYAQPLCRTGLDPSQSRVQEKDAAGLKQWLEDRQGEIWVNQPARDGLGKFVEMPPVADKELEPLVDKEIAQKFPLSTDELTVARWLQPYRPDASRQVALIASKRSLVRQRLAIFEEFGITPTAVQCEQAALVNFVDHEFASMWLDDEGADETVQPAIAMVDVGASGATAVVVAKQGFVFRSVDGGGEDLTRWLARNHQLTSDKAEARKRDPAIEPEPAARFPQLSERMKATANRLRRVVEEARGQLGDLEVQGVWCVGAGSLTHNWAVQLIDPDTSATSAAHQEALCDDDDDFEID